jgi:hypothetical protein
VLFLLSNKEKSSVINGDLTAFIANSECLLRQLFNAWDYTGMLGKVVMSKITKKKQLQKRQNIASI